MAAGDSVGVLAGAAVLGALVVAALAAPLLRPPPADRRRTGRTARRIFNVTALVAIALMALGHPLYVFLAVFALNATLGRNESVPFSAFRMFSNPRDSEFSIRFVDHSGAVLRTKRLFGVEPSVALKLYNRELRALQQNDDESDAATRERTAGDLAIHALLKERRVLGLRGDVADFRLEMVRFSLVGSTVVEDVRILAERANA